MFTLQSNFSENYTHRSYLIKQNKRNTCYQLLKADRCVERVHSLAGNIGMHLRFPKRPKETIDPSKDRTCKPRQAGYPSQSRRVRGGDLDDMNPIFLTS